MMTIGIPLDRTHTDRLDWHRRDELEREIISGLMRRKEEWLDGWAQRLLPPHLYAVAGNGCGIDALNIMEWFRENKIVLVGCLGGTGWLVLYRDDVELDRLNILAPLLSTVKWEPCWGTDPVTGMRWR